MGEIIIRHWQEGDDERIFDLFDRTERWLSNEAYRVKFNDKGLAPEGILLAESGELIIAHLMGSRTRIFCEGEPKRFGSIGQVMVDADFRGRKIGKEMIRRIVQYHIDGGCRGVILWTQDDRIPAYPMYEKVGFRPVVRRVFYHLRPREMPCPLSVEPYTAAFAESAEIARQAWMRSTFPMSLENMKPAEGAWWVAQRQGRCLGYVHLGENEGRPLISRAVAHPDQVSDVCQALLNHLAESDHGEIVWQTCVDSLWERELRKRGYEDRRPTSDVRMCLPIGAPIAMDGLRPEFDGCSTW